MGWQRGGSKREPRQSEWLKMQVVVLLLVLALVKVLAKVLVKGLARELVQASVQVLVLVLVSMKDRQQLEQEWVPQLVERERQRPEWMRPHEDAGAAHDQEGQLWEWQHQMLQCHLQL